MSRQWVSGVLVAWLCFTLCLASTLPADALVGRDFSKWQPDLFCPAQVTRVVPMHQLHPAANEHDLGTDTEFVVVISADVPKSITASLRFFSKDQAYEAPFTANIVPGMTTVTVQNGRGGPIVQPNEATPIVVRLPASMPLDAVWIDNVVVDGKAAVCGALPLMSSGNLAPDQSAARDASDSDVRVRAVPQTIDAAAIGKWDMHNCPQMVTEASVVTYVQPYYPVDEVLGGTALIGIALSANAVIEDLTIVKGTGYTNLDRSALAAVARTAFKPRLFLCARVPSYYVERVTFEH